MNFSSPQDTIFRIDSVDIKRVSNQPWSREVLTKEELNFQEARSFGEFLNRSPGVQNSYHGPNAGAPMIRSMSGNRIRVLQNNTSISDLSGISPNFSIPLDPDQVQSVEIYKSQASVRYGGRAIGGAVNVNDNSIPQEIPNSILKASATTEWMSNSGHRMSVDLTGKSSPNMAWHLSGSWRKSNEIKIPGSPKVDWAYDGSIDDLQATMAQVFIDKESIQNITLYPYLNQYVLDRLDDPSAGLSIADLYTFNPISVIDGYEVDNPANKDYVSGQDKSIPLYTTIIHGIDDYAPVRYGYIPNSHADHKLMNIGYTWHIKRGSVGVAYRGSEGYFGVPGFAQLKSSGHSHTHDTGVDDAVTTQNPYSPINTRSLSNSLIGEFKRQLSSFWIEEIQNNYSVQFSDDRELIGIYQVNKYNTVLHNNRLEVKQKGLRGWAGLSGVDISARHIVGKGSRRYMPNTKGFESGIYTQQQFTWKPIDIDAGYRIERIARRAILDDNYKRGRGMAGGNLSSRNFVLQQFNTALTYRFFDFFQIMASYQHAERAPEVNELYTGNEHFATIVEENGDDRLNPEINNGVDVGIAFANWRGWKVKYSYYHNTFQNYLYLAHTGLSRSGGFLVKEWRASDTEISGWELELQKHYISDRGIELLTKGYFDIVKNRNISDDPMRNWAEGDFMPNLPTSRWGFSSQAQLEEWKIYLAFDRFLQQKMLGKNINIEPPMPAFSLLSAQVGYEIPFYKFQVEIYVAGSNLLNSEARPQQSILKYLSPMPGRNITTGLKMII